MGFMDRWTDLGELPPSVAHITPLVEECLPPPELRVPEIRLCLLSSHGVASPQLSWHTVKANK